MTHDVAHLNTLTSNIIGGGIQVHRILGPGLLETPYRVCLAYELRKRGMRLECERAIPLRYEEVTLDCVYRLDLVVENAVAVEVKAVEQLGDVHVAQMLTYLRLADLPLGLLMNFNALTLKDGLRRVINTKQAAAGEVDTAMSAGLT